MTNKVRHGYASAKPLKLAALGGRFLKMVQFSFLL